MRTNLWSAFTLAAILMIAVGMVYNNEAGATPPKENKVVQQTTRNKAQLESPKYQQQIVPTALQSKLAAAMAANGTKFVMGGSSVGMGFRGTGGGGGGDNGFARIHGLGKLEKSSKAKPVKAGKKKKKKAIKAPQALPCSQAIPVYDPPRMSVEQ